ncbi:ATP transmembrane transporter [Aureococcus anophagefferens]|nr:ATP transmembrane transporter [Aureococcus anophagefferens]
MSYNRERRVAGVSVELPRLTRVVPVAHGSYAGSTLTFSDDRQDYELSKLEALRAALDLRHELDCSGEPPPLGAELEAQGWTAKKSRSTGDWYYVWQGPGGAATSQWERPGCAWPGAAACNCEGHRPAPHVDSHVDRMERKAGLVASCLAKFAEYERSDAKQTYYEWCRARCEAYYEPPSYLRDRPEADAERRASVASHVDTMFGLMREYDHVASDSEFSDESESDDDDFYEDLPPEDVRGPRAMGFFTKAKATKHERLSDANVKKLFDQYDVDHSGTLDHEEMFTDFIHHQEEQIEVVFDEIDVDGSGAASRGRDDFREIRGRACCPARSSTPGSTRTTSARRPRTRRTSRSSSTPGKNATGEISYDEFRHALLFLNPTDFALFADDWMHYASADDLGTSHASTHPTTKATTKGPPTWLNGLAGAISAAISRTAVAPLERLRFQMITDGAKYGGSSLACLRGIAAEEGVKAFWRGNGVNMIRIFPQNGLMFFAKPAIGKKMKAFVPDPFYGSMLSGMAAGCVSASAIYPLDVVRLRMTTTPGLYKGVIDGFKTIAAKEGPAALFRGIAYANLWAVPYTGALFAGQQKVRARKMQAQGTGGRPVLYSSIWGCIAGTVKTGGVGALYTGCAANVVKMAPAQAITFGCMTVIVPALTDALV